MKILVYDTECNSLDTSTGFVQELAWGIWDAQARRCVKAQSSLVKWDMEYQMDEGAAAVTGLSKKFCDDNGQDSIKIFSDFEKDLSFCDYLCGHNAKAYDKPMMISNLIRSRTDNRCDVYIPSHQESYVKSKTLIDTFTDIEYPKNIKMQSLKYLAFDHGYILNGAHEALNDVFACAHLLFSYDLNKTISNAVQPIFKVQVTLKYNDPNTNFVKESGFKWNPDLKVWHRNMRSDKLSDFKLPYPEGIKIESFLF